MLERQGFVSAKDAPQIKLGPKDFTSFLIPRPPTRISGIFVKLVSDRFIAGNLIKFGGLFFPPETGVLSSYGACPGICSVN